MLEVVGIDAGYKDLQALWGVSLRVNEGELVALVGPNGAGKTTTLKTISGLVKPTAGNVLLDGYSFIKEPPHRIVERGISQVLEGGRVFTGLTVMENLELGAFSARARKDKAENLERVFALFPRLKERQRQRAGTHTPDISIMFESRVAAGREATPCRRESSLGMLRDGASPVASTLQAERWRSCV